MKLHTKYENQHGLFCLEERWNRNSSFPPRKGDMLDLVSHIRDIDLDIEAYAVLSMNALVLTTEPDSPGWPVRIELLMYPATIKYHLYVPIPRELAPWPNAIAYSELDSFESLIQKIELGIRYCGAWNIPNS